MDHRISLRPATSADTAFLTSVTRRLGEVPIPPWRTPSEVAAADLRQMLPAVAANNPSSIVLVAEDAGDPVGCLFVTTEEDFFSGRPGAHVEVVAVKQEAEGRGLARRLLDAAESWARAQGYDHMTLNVFVGNARARAVYESLGYGAETVRYRKSLYPAP